MPEVTLFGGQRLSNTHSEESCKSQFSCAIHRPSEHNMSDFPQNFRPDTGVIERICPHGIGHPDPDHMVWARSVGMDWHGVHGCDLCCQKLDTPEIDM